jgi:predicted transcriptional regulator
MRFSPRARNASPRTSAAASRICGIETELICGVIVVMRFASQKRILRLSPGWLGESSALYWRQTTSREPLMLANLSVDADLLQTAIDLDTQNTKETIVEAALREYIYHRQQLKEAVMIGAAAADRGDVIDGETAIASLQEKLNAWRNEAS